MIVGLYALFVALIGGLTEIGILRDLYIQQKNGNALSMLGIRYGYLLLIAMLLLGIISNLKRFFAFPEHNKINRPYFQCNLAGIALQ